MLKSVACLGATLLSICAELRARLGAKLRLRELCKIEALRALRRAKAPGQAIDRYIGAEGGKKRRRRKAPKAEKAPNAETKKWPYLDA